MNERVGSRVKTPVLLKLLKRTNTRGPVPPIRQWRYGRCWLWTGTVNDRGYGVLVLWVNGKNKLVKAHRAMFEAVIGPMPDGMEPDHLCRVRRCVNPEHLEPVTHGENLARGDTTNWLRRRQICANGHDVSGPNGRLTPTGRRRCRQCNREYMQRRTARLNADGLTSRGTMRRQK